MRVVAPQALVVTGDLLVTVDEAVVEGTTSPGEAAGVGEEGRDPIKGREEGEVMAAVRATM